MRASWANKNKHCTKNLFDGKEGGNKSYSSFLLLLLFTFLSFIRLAKGRRRKIEEVTKKKRW